MHRPTFCLQRSLMIAFFAGVFFAGVFGLSAMVAAQSRATPPTRDPHTAGDVKATELPDGLNAPADKDGDFIVGPTHTPAPEMTPKAGVPQGTIVEFTMSSAESKLYPGIARDAHTFGTRHGRSEQSGEAESYH